MPLILYAILGSPPCLAVRLAARALKVDLELNIVDMGRKDHKSEAFLEMNPAHCVPTLDDNGFILWQSRSIMTYLSSTYGKDDKLYPTDVKQRAVIDSMLQFDMELYASLAGFVFPQIFSKSEADSRRYDIVRDKLKILDTILERRPYAAGDHMTLADISISCTLLIPTIYDSVDVGFKSYTNIESWLNKVRLGMSYFDDVASSGIDEFRKLQGKQISK